MRFKLSLCLLFLCTPRFAYSATCVLKQSGGSQVAVPIEYKISSSGDEFLWIYASLAGAVTLRTPQKEYSPVVFRIERRRLYMQFCVARTDLPTPEQLMHLGLGPRSFSLKARPVKWPRGEAKGAEGQMTRIVLEDSRPPDWMVLRSARFLPAEDGTLILEVIVSNLSAFDVPLETMNLDASRVAMAHACLSPDPYQNLTLEWDRILASAGAKGAWTTLGDEKIKVIVSGRFEGECSPLKFDVTVPIQQTIPSHSTLRLMLKLNQLPSSRRSRDGSDEESLLPLFMTYETWTIGLGADVRIWPPSLDLQVRRSSPSLPIPALPR